MTAVYVTSDWLMRGIKVAIFEGTEQNFLLTFSDGGQSLTQVEDGTAVEPTMRLNDDQGRALLGALIRHYEGGEDTRSLRRDYDAERARVDKLIEYVANPVRTVVP